MTRLRKAGIVLCMIFPLALWLIAAASELVLYKVLPGGRARRAWAWATIVVLIVSSTWLVFDHWTLWLAAWLLGAYKVIALLRVVKGRLPDAELQHMSVRAFSLLLLAQVAVTGIGWLVVHHRPSAAYGFDLLVALQTLATLITLRVTVNTWRHTAPGSTETNLSDNQLPSVSVLIPARNETEALERCLQYLVSSDYPKLELVVLDDCSAVRRTPEIIRSFAHDGVRFIKGAVPDESRWLAKNQAYARLAEEASGDVLIFCGVDVEFSTSTVRRIVELLHTKEKDMLSILPLRDPSVWAEASLLQPMRYYWEICLPRRFFKRPPVLSTTWAITAKSLKAAGGFEAVSRSVVPEAHFARQAVIGDRYSFIRSDEALGVYSTKPASEQYATTIRTRYPQLHRRLEMVALTTIFEIVFLLGPLIGLAFLGSFSYNLFLASLWIVLLVLLEAVYYRVAVRTKLNNPWIGWMLMPVAVVVDVAMLHVSLWKYEFSTVDWKGRNVCVPVMRVEPKLPPIA